MTNGQPSKPVKGTAGPDKPLAGALKEADCSYATLALRVNEPDRCLGSRRRRAPSPNCFHGSTRPRLEPPRRAARRGGPIADPSPAPPLPRAVDTAAESGRGLSVAAVPTDDWDTDPPEPGDPGKKVWFSLIVREPT